MSERSSIWSEGNLITTAASFAIGVLSKQDIEQQTEQYIKAGVLLKAKSQNGGIPEGALTTKEMLDLELKNIKLMRTAKDTQKAIYDPRELSKVILDYDLSKKPELDKKQKLNKGQRDSVLLMLTTKDRIVGVQGYAGTGKTFMMKAASELALRRGIELIGLAPSSSAARTLEQETNIPSHTLSRFLVQYNIVLQKWVNPKRIDLFKERFKNKLIILDEASLISSKQMYDFSRITNILNVRVVLSGDIKQCNAIEAGTPFEQFQKAGMKTARMKKIIRQTDKTLKEVVKDAAKGNIEKAYNKSIIEEIPGKNPVLAAQAIGIWASKSIEERKNTIITVTSRELRQMCNDGIRDILKKEGILTKAPKIISILQSRDLTHAQMENAKSYRSGDVILFNKSFPDSNIKRGQYYSVSEVKEDNVLILKQKFFSKYVKADLIAKDKGAIEVYHRQEVELQKGDTIRWTRNNKIDKDIVNSERATVTKVNKFSIEFVLANGTIKKIKITDSTLKHLDYAYTSTIYAAQGKTAKESINILPSISAQSSQKTFYVASSRAKSTAIIITNKYEKNGKRHTLLDHLLINNGINISAAEHQDITLGSERTTPKPSRLKPPILLSSVPKSESERRDTNVKDSKASPNKHLKASYSAKLKDPQYSTKEIYQSLFMKLPSLLPEFGFEYKGGKLISSTGQRISGEVGKSKGKVYVYENNPGMLIDYTGTKKTVWDYLKNGQLARASSREIMDYLLQHAGLGGGKHEVKPQVQSYKVKEQPTIELKKEVDNKLIKTILEFSQKNLVRKENDVLTYLKKKRGYSLDTIKKMELGYINSKAALGAYLRKLGFNNDKVKEAYNILHIIGKSHNLIIPYKDKEGNPIGLAGRNINYDSNSTVGKYLYTRGLSINSTLLNIHKVKEGGEIIIVEGVLDCLHAHAKGIANVIALGGTGFNKNQLKLLEEKKITMVNLCLDNDNAGITASLKIANEISKHLPSISLKQASLPNNIKDPDQMLRELGEPAFKNLIVEAKVINSAQKNSNTSLNDANIDKKPYYKSDIELRG